MPDALFKMKFDTVPEWGEEGEFELTRLTVSQLRQFKTWFKNDETYGQRLPIILKSFNEDAEAVMCLVWACRKENGLPVLEPNRMPDFDPAEVFVRTPRVPCPHCNGSGIDPASIEETEEVPKASESDTKTSTRSGSTEETPTNSGTPGSPSSDTSAT